MSQSTQVASAPLSSSFYGPDTASTLMGRRRCNLVMMSNPAVNEVADFQKIATFIKEIDPLIQTIIIENRWRGLMQSLATLAAPTLVFSPVPLARFRPLRGRLMLGQNLSKSQEYSALEKIGVPVPQWKLFSGDSAPDLSDFSPYVVTKPDRGGRGALVKIKRKGRVQPKSKPATNQNSANGAFQVDEQPDILAQEFIYTGQWPISYRVTTLFGKVLHSFKVEASHERNPLQGPDAFGSLPGDKGVSIVASGKGCEFSLNYDEEIIRFGEAAAAAFPDVPVLGVDVVRAVPGGNLYVLEVNAIGYIWHFSSKTGKRFQSEFNFNLESQFDGLRKAAHILAEKTQELAL